MCCRLLCSATFAQDLDSSLSSQDVLLSWLENELHDSNQLGVQGLQVTTPTAVQHALITSPALKAVVGLVQVGIETLPFGAPLSAAIGWMYKRGVKVCSTPPLSSAC